MDRKTVREVFVNWFYSTEIGEQYFVYRVEERGVKEIEYHAPMGEGDRHYCDITLEDGTRRREFNINSVVFA